MAVYIEDLCPEHTEDGGSDQTHSFQTHTLVPDVCIKQQVRSVVIPHSLLHEWHYPEPFTQCLMVEKIY